MLSSHAERCNLIYKHHRINGLNIVFTDRLGGYSTNNAGADYASLNLGFHVGDDYGIVQKNYSKILGELNLSGRTIAIAKQVHGKDMAEISRLAGNVSGFDWDSACEADMISLSSSDKSVGIMLFADCLPLVLYEVDGSGMACHALTIHIGWKGLVSDIVRVAISQFDNPQNITAVIGPGIDSCCYEINEDIAGQVKKLFPEEKNLENIIPVKNGKYHLSIKSAVIEQLRDRGVSDIIISSPCTSCEGDFYSHRRSSRNGKVTGRQASITYFDV